MRRVLVNHARDRARLKRGGEKDRVDLDRITSPTDSSDDDLLELDEALKRLSNEYPICAELVKLRFFGGMTLGDAAEPIGIPRGTADRHGALARAWLADVLAGGSSVKIADPLAHHQAERGIGRGGPTISGGNPMPDDTRNLMVIFAEALERTDAAARAAYLDDACDDDASLRQPVEAFLAAHDGAGRFLEPDSHATSETSAQDTEEEPRPKILETRPPSQPPASEHRSDGTSSTIAIPPPADVRGESLAGQVIAGRCRLLEVLGEGGMGTVYRASQTEPAKRHVAIQLIKIGMDSRAVLARFFRPAKVPRESHLRSRSSKLRTACRQAGQQ
jgi:hypothetical protein